MRTHTGETPYKCQLCLKSFATCSYLKIHIRTHTGEKPYKCRLCQRSFAEDINLKRHMRTHTEEKPYICEICNKRFSIIGHLKMHRRAHEADDQLVHDKRYAKNIFSIRVGIQLQNIKMERESIANMSEDAKPSLEKSFGCGVCDEIFERENKFVEHCSDHQFSPIDDLFIDLC